MTLEDLGDILEILNDFIIKAKCAKEAPEENEDFLSAEYNDAIKIFCKKAKEKIAELEAHL